MRINVYPFLVLAVFETHCGTSPQAAPGDNGGGSPTSTMSDTSIGTGSATGSSTSSSSSGVPSTTGQATDTTTSTASSSESSGASSESGGAGNPESDASVVGSAAAGPGGGLDGGASDAARPDAGRVVIPGPPDGGAVYAFPEAVGFGRIATGGRGGTVVHVTTLSDTGAGSLRDAVSAPNRIVVFDVGGAITVTSAISVSSNITIAGQTAPGDGVAIQGNELSYSAHDNEIVRYIRVRPGCTTCTSADPNYKRSGINLASTATAIIDHVSIEWAQWNNIDSVGATNITVEHSITADPVGQQFAAHTETGPYTWYGNLFANAHNRNPLAKDNTQFVNNVIYNYQAGYTAGNTAGTFMHDIVNNIFIAGPSTTSPSNAFFQVNNQPMYLSGNLLDSNANGMLDGTALGLPGGAVALNAPWSPATMPLPPAVSATAAYAAVVADAGASLHRDQVDTLVVADLTSLGTKGQLWTTPTATGLANGGYGTLAGGTAPTDTDGDGMPDAWEVRYGLNPNANDANGDFDHTGYTNIEKYINGLVDGQYP